MELTAVILAKASNSVENGDADGAVEMVELDVNTPLNCALESAEVATMIVSPSPKRLYCVWKLSSNS